MPSNRTSRSLVAALALPLVVLACSTGAGGATTPRPSPSATAASATAAGGGCPPAVVPAANAPAEPTLKPPAVTPLPAPVAEAKGSGTTATLKTCLGDIVIELFTESAPLAARNFIALAEADFYDGVAFHRLVPGFVIQGGDGQNARVDQYVGDLAGTGGPGYSIQDEPVVGKYGRGIVAMARSSRPNSQGSQFFIVLDDQAERALESARTYSIFGRVTQGMDVVDKIGAMRNRGEEGEGGSPVQPLPITDVVIANP